MSDMVGEKATLPDGTPVVAVSYDHPRAKGPAWATPKWNNRLPTASYSDFYVHTVLNPAHVYWVKDEIEDAMVTSSSTGPALPVDKKARKETPIARGVLNYFPRALAAVANVSYVGNEQHNPGQPMHWAKEKSNDHADCIVRHLIEAGTVDTDGLRHSAKVAWRALALLEIELEAEAAK